MSKKIKAVPSKLELWRVEDYQENGDYPIGVDPGHADLVSPFIVAYVTRKKDAEEIVKHHNFVVESGLRMRSVLGERGSK